ncbi:snaclec purpureotin subunit beta-like, partial [Notothenia coriiceps]|uniref:Snaclec purpureotin subunit beta-like n=1 Tax=Notothenia coriiceps TaxID=8208 RepID=A0A6I9MMG5_9TELE
SSVTFVFTKISSMNWTEAQSYCRAHYTDLASMRQITENQKTYEDPKLQIQAPVSTVSGAWEPARVSLYRDPWKWSDGFQSSFRYWAKSHPHSENCVAALSNGGLWVTRSCKSEIPFICYKHLPISKKVIKLRVKNNSNLNLNNEAVQKEIMVQIKKKLRDKRLDDNVELTWRTQQDGDVFHKEDEL